MKKISFLFVFLCFLFTSFLSFSQETYDPDYLKENIPKSPEASNLGTYGDISNNPYNGKLGLGVPLHNINFEGLVIPINLSYDSSGNRPSQEASWVGLNWSLSGRAQITRSIYGNDDLNENVIPPSNGTISALPFNDFAVSYTSNQVPFIPLNEIVEVHQAFAVGGAGTQLVAPHLTPDTQPDIYEVNLFNNSYRFRLNKRQGQSNVLTAHIFDNKNARIEYNLSTKAFHVWDDNGFYFVFETKEYSASFSSARSSNTSTNTAGIKEETLTGILDDNNQVDNTVITAWVLDLITSPTNDTVNFHYHEGGNFTMPQYNGFVAFNESVNEPSDDIGPTYGNSNVKYTSVSAFNYVQYLDKITGRFGEIKFNSSESRRDLIAGVDLKHIISTLSPNNVNAFTTFSNNGSNQHIDQEHGTSGTTNYNKTGRKLESIDVKDFNNKIIKSVNFSQSYFENDHLNSNDEAAYVKLKLDKVEVNDLTYSFDYESPDSFPIKNTLDTDFWGFYNGAGNLNNVPGIGRFCTVISEVPVNAITVGQVYYKFNGGDRSANSNFSKIGTLKKIVYPTGGYSTIQYEGNEAVISGPAPYVVTEYFPNTNIMRWSNLLNEDNYKFTYQYLKNATTPLYNFYNNRYDPNNSNTTETPTGFGGNFTVSTPAIINGQGYKKRETLGIGIEPFADYMKYYAKDINNSNNIFPLFYVGDWEGLLPGDPDPPYGDESVLIPPGTYRLIRRSENLPGEPVVRLDPEDFKRIEGDLETTVEEFEIGGLRIKTLATFDNNQSFVSKKEFEYEYQSSSNLSSSGKLMDDLTFHTKFSGYTSYNPVYPGPANSSSGDGVRITSNNNAVNPSAQGSHIGYSFVTEINLDENGSVINKIDRQFFNQKNSYFKENVDVIFWYNPLGFSNGQMPYVQANNAIMLGMAPKLNFLHLNGNLITEDFYDCNDQLMRSTFNEYESLSINPDDGHYANFLGLTYIADFNGNPPPWYAEGNTHYIYSLPAWYSKKASISRSETVEYLEGDVSYDTRYFDYDENLNLIETEDVVDDTESSYSRLYYPYSPEVYNNSGMSILRGEELWNQVVRQESYLNNLKVATRDYIFEKNTNTGNNARVTSIEQSKTTNTPYTQVQYDKYDSSGNLLQYHLEDGTPVSYIYGYNDQFVIAKIENAPYTSVSSYASNLKTLSNLDNDDCYDNGNCSEKNLRDALNNLRSQSSLSNALISTYTYNPLIGVTSITDPRGRTHYYRYDTNNRLESIVDQELNILSENEYGINHELITSTGTDPIPINFCANDAIANRSSAESQNSAKVMRNNTVQGGMTYTSLDNQIDLISATNDGITSTYTFKSFPYGGTNNYEFRWKIKGQTFTSYATNDTWSVSFDCSETGRMEIICELKDSTLEVSTRSHLKFLIDCTNN